MFKLYQKNFGGGGHITLAGAQVEDMTCQEVKEELINRIKDADVIIAPIADNKMFNIMRQFGDGDITTVQAIHSLATSGLGKQFVLKTSKAISHLTQVERLFLSSSERKAISTLMEDRGREIDTKLKLSKREFRGKGQYIDELFK